MTNMLLFPGLRRTLAGLSLGLAGLVAVPAAQADAALYESFGGEAGVARVVDDFIANLTTDPRTQPYFAKTSIKRFRSKLNEHFCAELGGPCTYTGSSMAAVHKNLQIDRAAFNAVVEDLQDAMDKNGVGFGAQNALLARRAPLHRQIETR